MTAVAGIFSCSSPSGSTPSGDSTPQHAGADTSFLGKKRTQGIDFYAVGQEPGWALYMDTAYNYSFKSYDGVEIGSPPVSGTTSPDGKTTSYHASVEMGELYITITREACMDTMSGEKFPCKVLVRIKRGVDNDFKTYDGCGRFL